MSLRPRSSCLAIAIVLGASSVGCVDVPEAEPPAAAARGTTLPGACSSGQGQLQIRNTSRQVVVATVTEADGRISSLTIPPGHDDVWNVAVGATTISASASEFRDPLLSTVVDVGCDAVVATAVAPHNFRVPAKTVMTTTTGQTTTGRFSCGTARNLAGFRRSTVGRNVEYTLTCNDPRAARATRKLTVVYPYAATVAGTPEPLQGCLEHFAAYQKPSTMLPYFTADFSPFGLDCKADSTAGGTPTWDHLGTALFPPATGGDLAIVRHHVQSDPDLHDAYDAYEQQTTLFSGDTGNTVVFRYRNKHLDDAPADGLKLQISGTGSPPGNLLDPCADAFTTPELIEQQEIDITSASSSPFEARFTRFAIHLNGPAVFYARVVPYLVDDAGYGELMCVDGVSNWVRLDVDEDDPAADQADFWNAYTAGAEAKAAANLAKQGYVVTAQSYFPPVQAGAPDDYRHLVVSKPVAHLPVWPIGCAYYVPESQPSKPWYKKAWDGLVSAIDYVNSKYTELKAGAISGVVASTPGVVCDGTCKGLIAASMNDALGHLRIPSDLPNLDTVIGQATPYTARYLDEKATKAVNPDAPSGYLPMFEQIFSSLGNQVTVSLSGGSAVDPYDMFTWGKPDPAYRAYPPVLWVHIQRSWAPDATLGNYFWLQDTNHIWKSRKVEIPAMAPGEAIDVPVFLEPSIKDLYSSSGFQSYNDASNRWYWQTFDFQNGAGVMNLRIKNEISDVVITQPAGQSYGTFGARTPAPACP